MELDIAIKIAALLALLIIFLLAIYLIISLRSATKLIKEASVSLKSLTDDILRSLDGLGRDMKELKEKVIDSLNDFDHASNELSTSIEVIKSHADSIYNAFVPFSHLARVVYDRVAPPINTGSLVISAASKAINAFVNSIGKKKG